MARMTEGSLPQSSAIFVNKLPWRRLDLSSLEDLELLEDHLRAKYSGAVEDVSM